MSPKIALGDRSWTTEAASPTSNARGFSNPKSQIQNLTPPQKNQGAQLSNMSALSALSALSA
jgi:hypothetical protein